MFIYLFPKLGILTEILTQPRNLRKVIRKVIRKYFEDDSEQAEGTSEDTSEQVKTTQISIKTNSKINKHKQIDQNPNNVSQNMLSYYTL